METRRTALERRWFRSRVARRVFCLFALSALLPIGLLAAFAASQVSGQLEQDARTALRVQSKRSAMAVLERLQLLAVELRTRAENTRAPWPEGALLESGVEEPGWPPALGPRNADEWAHLTGGDSLLRVVPSAEGAARLFLVVENRRAESGWLYGELAPDRVWRPDALDPSRPFVVVDEAGYVLFAHPPEAARSAAAALAAAVDASAFGFDLAGREQIASGWPLFLQASLRTSGWTFVEAQSSDEVLAPMREFRGTFPLVVLLGFLLALLLSASQIRRSLVPIEILKRAARDVERGNFDAELDVNTNDEFRDLADSFRTMARSVARHVETAETVASVSRVLSSERDTEALLRAALSGARQLACADGGAVYRPGRSRAAMVEIESIGLSHSGNVDREEAWPALEMARRAAAERRTLRVADAYDDPEWVEAVQAFDVRHRYRTRSVLVVPMENDEGDPLGVVVLLNARHRDGREATAFDDEAAGAARWLVAQVAMALSKDETLRGFKTLFEGLVELVVHAIDEKSAHTAGHCRRVPILAEMIAEAACSAEAGPWAGFVLTSDERYELRIAAFLHDCGKVTTPAHVLNKARKLEAPFDRMALIDCRFDALAQEARARWQGADDEGGRGLDRELAELREEREFLRGCNDGQERMRPRDQDRVRELARTRHWTTLDGASLPLLSDEEVEHLSVERGTLTPAEREVVRHHVVATIRMLEQLPYPKTLRAVPAIAGSHHERVDGKGYPNRLTRDEIDVRGRMLALADVFEALTAPDRPYKRRMTLKEALEVLRQMRDEGHVDPELHDLFLEQKLYLRYAARYMHADQIDESFAEEVAGETARALVEEPEAR